MKYCTSCGAVLEDNAVFCTKCGSTLAPASNQGFQQQTQPQPQAQPQFQPQPPFQAQPQFQAQQPMIHATKSESILPTLFGFIANMCFALTLFMLILSLFGAHISSHFSGSSSYYSYSYNIYSYFYANDGYLGFALVMAICSFGFGVATFIMTLVKRLKGDKLFAGISKLVFGVLLLLGTIIATTF